MTTVKEQLTAVRIHAVRTLPASLSFLQYHVSPHQCQVFLPLQLMSCLIWLAICLPTKQKWPSQHLSVLTATWERTLSNKDKPLCAGMMLEGGDSPGCPNRVNSAPASRLSHRGCRRQTFRLVLEMGSGIKNEPFWARLKATVSYTLVIPSQIFTWVAPDHTWTIICSRPDVQIWSSSLVPVLRYLLLLALLFFCHHLFLINW